MTQIERQYVHLPNVAYHTIETVYATDEVKIVYTHFKPGAELTRLPLKNWLGRTPAKIFYDEPGAEFDNAKLQSIADAGCELVPAEHLMIALGGKMITHFGNEESPVNVEFALGDHNSEGGAGYLPVEGWSRTIEGNHHTACAIMTGNGSTELLYRFEPIQIDGSWTAEKDYDFVHFCYGAVEVNGNMYQRYDTIHDVQAGTTVMSDSPAYAIAGWTEDVIPAPQDDS